MEFDNFDKVTAYKHYINQIDRLHLLLVGSLYVEYFPCLFVSIFFLLFSVQNGVFSVVYSLAGVNSKRIGKEIFSSISIPHLEWELDLKDLEQNELNWN